MKNKRKKISEKNGLYIAIGCCALVICAVGYVGSKDTVTLPPNSIKEEIQEEKISQSANEKTEYVNESVTVQETDDKIIITPKKEVKENPKKEEKPAASEVSKPKKAEELTFKMPVEGKVVCEFSENKLLYNETLSDWRTHNGIDITCDTDSAIYAAADGTVEDILSNSMGKTVIISHNDNYKTVYSNLSDKIEITKGNKISSGDLIGKIGDTALSDFTQEPHLHFEILQNDKYIDPVLKLNTD